MEIKFERNNFGKRLKSMLSVDFRRMFTIPLFYILTGVCLVMPILILVMTMMMDGSVSVNSQTGVETVMTGYGVSNLVMCIFSKMLLAAVFVPIYLIVSVVAKQQNANKTLTVMCYNETIIGGTHYVQNIGGRG